MRHVNTVLGTLHPEEMGNVAVREHIMWGPSGWEFDSRTWFKIGKAFERAFNELLDFKLIEGQTVVDGSGIGWGRDPDIYVKVASVTGVNIVASTGFWSGRGTPPHFRRKSAQDFEELFVHELNVGIGHTRFKAGAISVGSDASEMTPLEEEIYRGAARASRATGVALFTHGIDAIERQIEIFREESLDFGRVVVGDCDRSVDIERDKWLAGEGVCVAYDNVGLEHWSNSPGACSDDDRVDLVSQMFRAGHGDKVMISAGSKMTALGQSEAYLSNIGNLVRYFLPKLSDAGLTQADVDMLLTDNPKRVLPINGPQ